MQPCQAAAAKGFGQKVHEEAKAKGKGRLKGKGADASVNGEDRQVSPSRRAWLPVACISTAADCGACTFAGGAKAIQAVEGRRKGQKARPVDPKEAARGRLDYVQVKDWGGGSPDDLESMQVRPILQPVRPVMSAIAP